MEGLNVECRSRAVRRGFAPPREREGELQLLASLGEFFRELMSRFGTGGRSPRDRGALDPEALKPTGPDIPLGPRAHMVETRAGNQRYLLKRWLELPPDARRDLARRIAERKALGGPQFLPVLASGEKLQDRRSGYVYCIQEHRPRSLTQYLHDLGGPCPLEHAASVVRTVGEALSLAHARSVTHGGLCPDAVYVSTENGAVPGDVVVDFVRLSGVDGSEEAALTIMDLFPSGRTYIAPEALLGNPVDELSDLFLLGVLAYEVFTGRPPFVAAGTSTTDKVRAILAAQIEPPGRHRPDLPNRWEAAVMRLLRKERGQRYPSAGAFLEAVAGGL